MCVCVGRGGVIFESKNRFSGKNGKRKREKKRIEKKCVGGRSPPPQFPSPSRGSRINKKKRTKLIENSVIRIRNNCTIKKKLGQPKWQLEIGSQRNGTLACVVGLKKNSVKLGKTR